MTRTSTSAVGHQGTGWLSPFLQSRRLRACLPFLTDGRVLDLGCGPGDLARFIDSSRYVGVDLNESTVLCARNCFPKHCFYQSEEFNTLFPEDRFDTIVALAVIEHVADPSAWLSELSSKLAAHGRIVLTTPEPRVRWVHEVGAWLGLFSREAAEEHETFLDRRQLQHHATAANLTVQTFKRFLAGCNQLCVLGRETDSDQ